MSRGHASTAAERPNDVRRARRRSSPFATSPGRRRECAAAQARSGDRAPRFGRRSCPVARCAASQARVQAEVEGIHGHANRKAMRRWLPAPDPRTRSLARRLADVQQRCRRSDWPRNAVAVDEHAATIVKQARRAVQAHPAALDAACAKRRADSVCRWRRKTTEGFGLGQVGSRGNSDVAGAPSQRRDAADGVRQHRIAAPMRVLGSRVAARSGIAPRNAAQTSSSRINRGTRLRSPASRARGSRSNTSCRRRAQSRHGKNGAEDRACHRVRAPSRSRDGNAPGF